MEPDEQFFWVLFIPLQVIEILPETSKCLKRHEHLNSYSIYTLYRAVISNLSGFPPELITFLEHCAHFYCSFILLIGSKRDNLSSCSV